MTAKAVGGRLKVLFGGNLNSSCFSSVINVREIDQSRGAAGVRFKLNLLEGTVRLRSYTPL